jgi:hypothetical protein
MKVKELINAINRGQKSHFQIIIQSINKECNIHQFNYKEDCHNDWVLDYEVIAVNVNFTYDYKQTKLSDYCSTSEGTAIYEIYCEEKRKKELKDVLFGRK